MMRRCKHLSLPFIAVLVVLSGVTAGVSASTGIELPTWGGSGSGTDDRDLVAGPLGLNPVAVAGSQPVAIRIPDATVDAEVELNQIVDGVMLDPSGPWVVSWYRETGMLGEIDNTVMSGHVDYWEVGDAVFANVGELVDNAPIMITDEAGNTFTYAVEWIETYDVDALTSEVIREIVGPTDYRALTLITCGGTFDTERGEYLARTIVRARLVDAELATGAAVEETTPEATETVVAEETVPEEVVSDVPAGEIGVGGTATVTDSGVNLRDDASTGGNVVTTLAAGAQLAIIGGPVEADGFTWWQVQTDDGTQGWIAGAFIEP